MTKIYIREEDLRRAITIYPATPGTASEIAARVEARWGILPGLATAALHLAPDGTQLVEYLEWSDPAERDVTLAAISPDAITVEGANSFATIGPEAGEGEFALPVDTKALRPVLVTVMRCAAERQDELMAYLVATAERFRTAFGGWTGAVLLRADDGTAIAEYLQFDSIEAMGALQGLPILTGHMANIAAYGAVTSAMVLPTVVRAFAQKSAH